MTKSRLNFLRGVLFVMTVIFSTLFAISCAQLKGTFSVEFPENLVFEYMTDVEIPAGKVTDEGKEIKNRASYIFTSPSEKTYQGKFPMIFCNEVGEWQIEYSYGDQSIKKTFSVVDSTEPELKFVNIPGDVFVSEGARYNLPDIEYKDLSPRGEYSKSLTLNGQPAQMNELTNKFYAETVGEFVYTVTGADIYGNETTISAKWNAKDREWTPSADDDAYSNANCLASYDEAGYINSVESGTFSHYWNAKPQEEFLEEYKGASGVLKLSGELNSFGCAGFMFNLANTIQSKEELKDKTVIIKILTENDIEKVWFGSMKWIEEIDGHIVQCCENFPVSVTKGEWTYIKLSAAKLEELNYFDDGEDGFNAFQIGFGEAFKGDILETANVYIDYAVVVDELDKVKNITLNGNVLSFDQVEGADKYEIIENGERTEVSTNSYTMTDTTAVVTVRALSEGNIYKLSSEIAMPYIPEAKNGYILDFNGKAHEKLVFANDYVGHTAKSITAEYLGEYLGQENVLKITTVNNSVLEEQGVGFGDVVIQLPKASTGKLTLKYMIEESNASIMVIQQPNTEWGFDEAPLSVTDDWQYACVNYDEAYNQTALVYDKLEFSFYGPMGGTNVLYLAIVADGDRVDEIKQAESLETVLGDLDVENDELASFDIPEYKDFIGPNYYPNHTALSIDTEYLEEYQGETGVFKITSTNNGVLGDAGFGDIIINLPKACTGSLTIKYMIKESDASLIILQQPRSEAGFDDAGILSVNNEWQYLHVNYDAQYASDKVYDRIEFSFYGGAVNAENVIYISAVWDGNKVPQPEVPDVEDLADALTGDYLADFSDELYTTLVSPYTAVDPHLGKYPSVEASILADYQGETNVLKVDMNILGNWETGMVLKLPKASNGESIELKIWTVNAALVQFANPDNSSYDGATDYVGNTDGMWATVTLDYSAYSQTDEVEIYVLANPNQHANVTIYISYVKVAQ